MTVISGRNIGTVLGAPLTRRSCHAFDAV